MELFGALRGRLYDSNKNLIMSTLSTIGGIASAMGLPVEKASKVCIYLLFGASSSHSYLTFILFSLVQFILNYALHLGLVY